MTFLLVVLLLFSASLSVYSDTVSTEAAMSMHFSTEREWAMDGNVHFSRNMYRSGMSANSYGVYPVVIEVDVSPEFLGVEMMEIEAIDRLGKIMVDRTLPFPDATEIVLPSSMSPEKPGEVWMYRMRFMFSNGRSSDWTDYQIGYGALTGEAFMKFYEKYAMKPWEFVEDEPESSRFHEKWEGSEILEKVNAHSLKSLGNITEHSRFHDGWVNYTSKARGFKGDIFFTYENFGELDTIWATGNFNMLAVSLSGNGKSCEGCVNVEGMYPAKVDFSDIRIVDYMPTGEYLLTQEGKPLEHVPASGNITFGD